MHRRVSLPKLALAIGNLEVALPQAQQRIMETPELSSNSDLERGPEIDANA